MDIVKWLHDEARCGFSNSKKLKEAADEIERLQEKHDDIRILNEQYYNENEILLDEIKRSREKYEKMVEASVAFQIAIQNALFAFEKTVDDIQQKDSE